MVATIMPLLLLWLHYLYIVHLGTSPIVVATGEDPEGGGGGPNQHDFFCVYSSRTPHNISGFAKYPQL